MDNESEGVEVSARSSNILPELVNEEMDATSVSYYPELTTITVVNTLRQRLKNPLTT